MVQFTSSPKPQGLGVSERRLHLATGLRNASVIAGPISTNTIGIVGAAEIGTADLSEHGTWPQGIRAAGVFPWNSVLPYPMTPTCTFYVVQGLGLGYPQTAKVRIRMRGTDQFGQYQEEITPWVTKVQTSTALWFMLHMSKVFATVDEVQVMTGNVVNKIGGSTASRLSVGWSTNIDPTMAAAAAFDEIGAGLYIADVAAATGVWELQASFPVGTDLTTTLDLLGTEANWGVALPLRVSPYGPNNPFPTPELMGCSGTLVRSKGTPITALGTTAKLPVRGQLSVAGVAPTTGVCIGRSLAGWQGTPHKLGFFSTDAWVTKIAGINLGGSSTRAAGVPIDEIHVGEDELQISALMRTWDGTQRDANATSSYPRG